MNTLYAVTVEHKLRIQQWNTPQRRHLASALAARTPWRRRFMRRLRLLATQPASSLPAPAPERP
ncbi:hypothetical protein [Jiangella asiatica]|uniref:Uncharacterized protein n=1 Tax=Jiangella asiatica TaxID=2530372 RepID=A0A4R5CP60_9ACTN|nr:hypothetical protein [Jiangella asiatica]TDE01177.1 hypothetical protein E1269_23730 [Jiangella asiatica]